MNRMMTRELNFCLIWTKVSPLSPKNEKKNWNKFGYHSIRLDEKRTKIRFVLRKKPKIYRFKKKMIFNVIFNLIFKNAFFERSFLVETNRMMPKFISKIFFIFWCKGGPFCPNRLEKEYWVNHHYWNDNELPELLKSNSGNLCTKLISVKWAFRKCITFLNLSTF